MFTALRKHVGCYRRDRSGPDDRETGGLARELRYHRACAQYRSLPPQEYVQNSSSSVQSPLLAILTPWSLQLIA